MHGGMIHRQVQHADNKMIASWVHIIIVLSVLRICAPLVFSSIMPLCLVLLTS